MAKLTLSTGSNLGDRRELLTKALHSLVSRIGPALYVSEIVETPAWGRKGQPDFLNQLVILETGRPARGPGLPKELHRLLGIAQTVEAEAGRVRLLEWGARTLDIDLIFLDDVRYEDDRVSLPHPWWRHRDFVTALLPEDPKFAPRYSR